MEEREPQGQKEQKKTGQQGGKFGLFSITYFLLVNSAYDLIGLIFLILVGDDWWFLDAPFFIFSTMPFLVYCRIKRIRAANWAILGFLVELLPVVSIFLLQSVYFLLRVYLTNSSSTLATGLRKTSAVASKIPATPTAAKRA